MKKFVLLLTLLIAQSALGQGLYQKGGDDLHPTPPAVPKFVVFCGDTIRFDTHEKYERMDRELMAFTYMQTTTTLMLKRSMRFFAQISPVLKEIGRAHV